MQQHVLEGADPRVLGRRLQAARKARHLTQQDVAKSLELARTTITALEQGKRRIRPNELIQLARLYGGSVYQLVGPSELREDFGVQFRAAVAGAGPRQAQEELEQAIQSFQGLCEDYLRLERLNGAPVRRSYPSQYAIDGVPPEAAAEDVASSERHRLGIGDGPLLNLREILETDVGVRVFSIELPSSVAGLFAYTEQLGGCIAVNARHPEERRRWSMAHEYGHFLTSRFRSEVTMLATYERVPAGERFADAFAGCLLMPAVGLRRRFNEALRASGGKRNGCGSLQTSELLLRFRASDDAENGRTATSARRHVGGVCAIEGTGSVKLVSNWDWSHSLKAIIDFLFGINCWL